MVHSTWKLLIQLLILSCTFTSNAQKNPPPKKKKKNKKQQQQQNPPLKNLLFIITDQQRYDMLTRTQTEQLNIPPQNQIRTPNLDRLSYSGAYFTNAYTHCPVCGPARSSILTGRTIDNTGIRTNGVASQKGLENKRNDARWKYPSLRTFDEILVEDGGYVAEYYGKWHAPESKGFVYENDVRMPWAKSWFGKYEDKEKTKKKFTIGMGPDYREFLDANNIPAFNEKKNETTESGQFLQCDSFSLRPYIPDPIDKRYEEKESMKCGGVIEPDQNGHHFFKDKFSITAKQGQDTLDALERLGSGNKRSAPFSLTVSFQFPHAPMLPTTTYYNMYNPSDMIISPSFKDPMINTGYSDRPKNTSDKYKKTSNVQRWMANYYGLITEVDSWVGKILDKLEELNLREDTLIIFTSDHGEMLGSHGGMREKSVFYEESVHVPLFLSLPGFIKPNTVIHEPVSLLDLHNTILDYLDVNKHYPTDGTTLRRYIEPSTQEQQKSEFMGVVSEWNMTDHNFDTSPTQDMAFMIRHGDFKLILPNTANSDKIDMLYDLKNDPHEMNNLIGLNGMINASDEVIGKAEHLKVLLLRYLKQTRNNNRAIVGEMQRRRTWRMLDLWVSDPMLEFRVDGDDDGEKLKQWLHMGSTSSTDEDAFLVDVSIVGDDAANFELDWNKRMIPSKDSTVLTVSHVGSSAGSINCVQGQKIDQYAKLVVTRRSNISDKDRKPLSGSKSVTLHGIVTCNKTLSCRTKD